MAVSGITAPVPRGGMGFTYDPVYGPLYYFRGQYYSPDQVQSHETSEAGTSYDGVIQGATPFAPTQQTATMGQAPSGYMTLQQAAATKGGGRPEAPQNRFDIYEREGWAQLLPQLGFQGQVQSSTYTPDESVEGGMRESFGLTPEAQSFIDNLKQQGYQIVADKDKVWSGSKYTTRLGLADPQGNILSNWEEQEGSYFDQLGPMLAAFTPAFFGIGNAIASGAVGGGANALSGAGLGAMEGVGLSGNIINAATGQTIASLPTAAAASAPIFDLGGNAIDPFTSQVLSPASVAPATLPPLTPLTMALPAGDVTKSMALSRKGMPVPEEPPATNGKATAPGPIPARAEPPACAISFWRTSFAISGSAMSSAPPTSTAPLAPSDASLAAPSTSPIPLPMS